MSKEKTQYFAETNGLSPVECGYSEESGIPWKYADQINAIADDDPDFLAWLHLQSRAQFKTERQLLVDAIKVTTAAGNTFDGDEVSQTRMARAIAGLEDGETITWVLADNSVVNATKDELREALRLAGREQEEIWVMR